MDLETIHGITENKGKKYWVDEDVAGFRILFVNVYMVGKTSPGYDWVLVDAGLPGSANRIIREAEGLFGDNNPPKAIILTHGHFDHVGGLHDLLAYWPEVKVYAHKLELPYLTGKSSYPPPDPIAGGGGMAYMSWMYPARPYDFKDRINAIPEDGAIPGMPDWRWIHTPGHAPGHISLFRDRDRLLLAGDAFVTTDQNSMSSVISQKHEMHGPPAYFTFDWEASLNSIRRIEALNPEKAGTGHGLPVFHGELKKGLYDLVTNFREKEVPTTGRYVKRPARTNENGVEEMPIPVSYYLPRFLFFGALVAGVTALGYSLFKKYNEDFDINRFKREHPIKI